MGLRWTLAFAAVLGAAGVIGVACGGSGDTSVFDAGPTSTGAPPSGSGDDGSAPSLGDDGGGGGAFATDATVATTLTITPADPVLDVTGPGTTQQFTALAGSTPTTATWSLDLPAIGTIDGQGLFTASATRGGTATITAQTGTAKGTTTVTVRLHLVDNPASVAPGVQQQLRAGGTADAKFRWLYPYDKTIFPRGLTPPTLQLDGDAATYVYVHVTAKTIEYEGFFGASSPTHVDLPAAAWSAITASAGAGDPVTVAVTKMSGTAVSGPVTETWSIAQGSLKGTVYYNTYDSPSNNGRGAVMRVKPGQNASILEGGCTVCHAVSANGSVMVSLGSTVTGQSDAYYYKLGASYDLTNNAQKLHDQNDSSFGFAGMYPDGSLLVSCASMSGSWPPNIPGLGDVGSPKGDRPSKLLDPKTGAAVAAPGLDGVVAHALMPAFSPDGTKLVFNHFDTGQGKSLAVMDFTLATHTFGPAVDVVTDPTLYLGWPAFTPDSKTVVYNTVNYGDFATWNQYGSIPKHYGDLYAVDVATKAAIALDAANGMSGGTTYLPWGSGEAHLNYEPTVLPVAVGGYYWVVFTSRRAYGNTISPSTDPDPFEANPAKRKKLWVAAIDINPTPGKDPSHPAFYLPGQELGAGNMRGFWALDPCMQNGNDCSSGDECCTGFCRQVSGDAGTQIVCVPPPVGCSQEFEKCTTSADCCGASQGYVCVNGHCAQPPPR